MYATTDPLVAILGSFGGVAAIIAAIVGYLARRDTKNSSVNTHKIDLLEVGQSSLEKALQRADLENAQLRERIDVQEAEFELAKAAMRTELETQHEELITLKLSIKRCQFECEKLKKELTEMKNAAR